MSNKGLKNLPEKQITFNTIRMEYLQNIVNNISSPFIAFGFLLENAV